ncbi:TIGR00374 family protein [Streptomyces sp. PT12]|nr:TIGR00374 family protein [Streptomyces sp. PT12]
MTAALITVGLLVAISRRGELGRAWHLLTHVSPLKAAVALLLQAVSLLCLAALQRWLLATGGVRLSLATMMPLELGANAMAGAVPGGAAFGAAWLYRQFRRRGADQALTATTLAMAGAFSAMALLLIMVLGALTAGSRGPGALLLRVVAVLALVALAAVLLLRISAVRRAVDRGCRRTEARFGRLRTADAALRRVVRQARAVQPGVRPWLWPSALAVLNWVFDAACLVASLWALNIPVPWHGVLLAYGLVQIPGSLRLTPGGVGIVEAGLTGLLVVYGLPTSQAFAGALLYRIWNYWLLQPVGWACWVAITFRNRRTEPPPEG